MATLNATRPTLLDLAKRTDPDGRIASIVEILNETNEILDDMSWMEGNLATGHRTTIRSGLPAPTWRKMYGGVQPTKSTSVQVTDNCGMLEAYAEIDKALADLNGNTAEFRLSEERPFIEGLNQEVADTLFYGDEATAPEEFTGLVPRYNDTSAENADNIILGGAASGQTDCASIWLVVWGNNTCHGIVPKGSTAGIQMSDKGQVTIEDIDGSGGRMEAYRTHYRWDVGLTLRDWRYVVRISDIDRSLVLADASSGPVLPDLMFEAMELIPNLTMGRPAFYMDRTIRTKLRQQTSAIVANSTLTTDIEGGKPITRFHGIPIRRCDALAINETALA